MKDRCSLASSGNSPIRNEAEKERAMEVERRRYQNYLQCSGVAVILFGVWDIVKGFAFYVSNWSEWLKLQPAETQEIIRNPLARVIFIFLLGIFSLFTILFHFWMGKGAIFESRGNRLKRPYVTIAVFLVIVNVINVFFILKADFFSDEEDAMTFHSMIIDITYIFALSEMVRSAWKVRKLAQQSEQEEA